MLTDYLLPASDKVKIPRGYDITLTTATTGTRYIPVNPDEPRATISRDSENTDSMIDAWDDSLKKVDGTVLRINDLIFDGKSVLGSSDGGVKSKFVNVYINNVDFKNVYASNGGALLIMFSEKDKNNKATVPGTVMEVRNSSFIGCTSTTTETSNRLGGGAIVTNAETMALENCRFDTCTAVDQAGAVFHRVDSNYNSWTNITGCTFTNCRANAAGGLELDSKTITVTNTSFTNCVALQRNGGGFNVYALNSASPTADCRVTLENCTFTNCQANNFGGGFRSTAVYTKVMNCSFTNTSATGSYTGGNNGNGTGGASSISSGNAKKAEIYACTITGCTAIGTKQTDPSTGGGIYYAGSELIIGDSYTSVIEVDEENNPKVKTGAMTITNCTARNAGGGIYHKINSSNTNNFTMTNTVVTGNTTNNSTGGGIDTRAKTVTITGGSISNNTAKNQGGGLYTNASASLSITGTTISGNTTSGSSGGGVYYTPDNDTDPLTVNSCTIENNSAANGNGGGIYTTAGPITVGKADGYPTGTVIRGCTAKSGGGIYHEKNTGNAYFKLLDSTVSGCRATNGGGGGIRTDGWVVTLTGSTVSNNSATSNGGGLWLDGSDANRNSMSLTVNGSTVSGNTSGGNGGGIYTLVKTVALNSSYPVGTDTVTNGVNISGNTAAGHGGGLYHDRNAEGSALTVTGTEAAPVTVSGNKSTGSGKLGGGIYSNVHNAGFTWAEISGNRSEGSGGGVYQAMDGAGYAVTVDHTAVTGNTSGSGGGIYTKTNLYLRNDSLITGNRLTGNTEGNAAGVYLQDNRTLYVGSAGATEADSSSVKENYTAAGTASNLRLWWNKDRNDAASVYVYCPLNGSINVVNAAKVGTQFGTSAIPGPEGFTDDAPVFRADAGMLHGIIDRTDETGTRIIWAGKPVAKITDGNGNLLYLRQGTDDNGSPCGTSPAIFDRVYAGMEY